MVRIDKLMFESHGGKLIVAMNLRGLTLNVPEDKKSAGRGAKGASAPVPTIPVNAPAAKGDKS